MALRDASFWPSTVMNIFLQDSHEPFKGHEINGNTFYTIAQDKKSTNQNSGVRFDAANTNRPKDTYYGYIEEIWELDYGRGLKVPLFRCKWVNMTRGGVTEDRQYEMTIVDLNNLAYADEHSS